MHEAVRGETAELADFVARCPGTSIPEAVQHEAVRALVNWLGCALGGAGDPAVDTLLAALGPFAGEPQATLLGRGRRVDAATAALVNAVASNILDFDDTHLDTVIHPSVPIASALLALAEHRAAGGADFVDAFVMGVEVACRAGLAVGPGHYEAGWHITGSCGVLGAAAACARLIGLDATRTAWALGIAATQSCGLTEMMGSQSKSLNMGFAARNGLAAACLAAHDFTSSPRALEAPRGFAHVLGRDPALEHLTAGLGTHWALERNAYKPWPCGIVLHPVIDACLQIGRLNPLPGPEAITAVRLRVNPLVLSLTGHRAPRTGLLAKLSVYHTTAIALIDGAAGVREYTDQAAGRADVQALGARVQADADPGIAKEEAHVEVALADGRRLTRHVRCALGSLERPMSDADLAEKFRALADEVLVTDEAERLLALAWNVRALADAGAIARACAPEDPTAAPVQTPGSPLLGGGEEMPD